MKSNTDRLSRRTITCAQQPVKIQVRPSPRSETDNAEANDGFNDGGGIKVEEEEKQA